jgi:murein DD-endopeptidase MepM/ murein hydrolase activator NlpD
MPDSKNKDKSKSWFSKLRNKYRLVISNEDTFEQKISFRLSRLNVFVALGTLVILLVVATSFLIAFTPLREYIPGYTDVTLRKRVITLERLADSLLLDLHRKSVYIENIRNVIEGKTMLNDTISEKVPVENETYDNVKYSRSSADSALRKEYENRVSYDLYYDENQEFTPSVSARSSYIFFNPLKGIVTNEFDLTRQHYGIDIAAKINEVVKASLDGTVIFSDWTVETGYVITIQHQGTFVSSYKHNSVLLKKEGAFVKAGEPIAIVGESGELTTGPHLHFELWYNGTPVNPRDYISF